MKRLFVGQNQELPRVLRLLSTLLHPRDNSQALYCGICTCRLTLKTTTENYREIVKHYHCPQCAKTYEAQFAQISILVASAGEQDVELAHECTLCHSLYQDGLEHCCHIDQITRTS